jgi:hypothetical protein
MVDGLILEGKEDFFVLVVHMGRIIGSNFHGMSLEKDHNYLGTLCTLTCVIQCNKQTKVELVILSCSRMMLLDSK